MVELAGWRLHSIGATVHIAFNIGKVKSKWRFACEQHWTMNEANFVCWKINKESILSPVAWNNAHKSSEAHSATKRERERERKTETFEILRRSFTELYKSFCLLCWHLFLFCVVAQFNGFDHDFLVVVYIFYLAGPELIENEHSHIHPYTYTYT